MKKISLFLFLILSFLLVFSVACKEDEPQEVTYTVSFVTGTEEAIPSQTVKENEKAAKPADPVREGYEFVGWYYTAGEYDFDKIVVSDLTLTARWTEYFTVSFVTGTDASIESQEVLQNEKAVEPAAPTREGYEFAGWYLNDVAYDFNTAVDKDLTLTAKWFEYFTVTFVANGTVVKTQEVKEGESATAPTAPSVDGKLFIEWVGDFSNVTEDLEIVATYEDITYQVTFMVDGVNYGETVEVLYGANVDLPTDPEKLGYEFAGWDKELTNVTSNLTVNATFTAVEYTIKYYSGTEEITTLTQTKYTIEDVVYLENYYVEGLYFIGWFESSDLTGGTVSQVQKGTTGNKTFYALNATIDANGGVDGWETTPYATNAEAGSGIDAITSLPELFEQDFYLYLKDNNLLESDLLDSTMVAKTWAEFSGLNPNHNGDPRRIWNDTSSNAAGAANGYVSLFLYDKIIFNEDGSVQDVQGGFLGTEPYKTKYRGLLDTLVALYAYKVVNSKYDAITGNTNRCRAFMGFVIDGYFYGTQGIATDYFSVARNKIPSVNVGYKLVDGSIVEVQYDAPQVPVVFKLGYEFAGWYLDAECTIKLGSEPVEGNPVLYAGWVALS